MLIHLLSSNRHYPIGLLFDLNRQEIACLPWSITVHFEVRFSLIKFYLLVINFFVINFLSINLLVINLL